MTIKELEAKLAAANNTIDALKQEDIAQLQQISMLNNELQATRTQLSAASDSVESLEASVMRLTDTIASKDSTIADLKASGGRYMPRPMSQGYSPTENVIMKDEDAGLILIDRGMQ